MNMHVYFHHFAFGCSTHSSTTHKYHHYMLDRPVTSSNLSSQIFECRAEIVGENDRTQFPMAQFSVCGRCVCFCVWVCLIFAYQLVHIRIATRNRTHRTEMANRPKTGFATLCTRIFRACLFAVLNDKTQFGSCFCARVHAHKYTRFESLSCSYLFCISCRFASAPTQNMF